jgi:hypothetical protein
MSTRSRAYADKKPKPTTVGVEAEAEVLHVIPTQKQGAVDPGEIQLENRG